MSGSILVGRVRFLIVDVWDWTRESMLGQSRLTFIGAAVRAHCRDFAVDWAALPPTSNSAAPYPVRELKSMRLASLRSAQAMRSFAFLLRISAWFARYAAGRTISFNGVFGAAR